MGKASSYVPPVLTASGKVATAAVTMNNALPTLKPLDAERARQEEEIAHRNGTIIVAFLASTSIVVAIVAMYIEASMICYIAFGFPLVIAPYSIHQRRRLNKMPTLVSEINRIRLQVNRLAVQNQRLTYETSRLERERSRLSQVEIELELTCAKTGSSVNELQRLIHENGSMQRKMKKLQEARELQNMLTAFLQSDTNHDSQLSDMEIDQLMIRLRAFSNKPLDEERLREAFRNSASFSTTTLFSLTSGMMQDESEQDRGSVSYAYSQCM